MADENLEQTGTAEQERGRRKTRVGTVVSDKMNKTVVVKVERRYAHPLYGKQLTRTKKYHAHDETNVAKVGDIVWIEECAPISKNKRWTLVPTAAAAPSA